MITRLRLSRFLFSQAKEIHTHEVVAKMQELRHHIKVEQEEIA